MAYFGQSSSQDARVTDAMNSLLNKHIDQIRDEGNPAGDFNVSYDIKTLFSMFLEGRIDMFGEHQRSMVCTLEWMQQLLKTIVNAKTTTPRFMMCKRTETRRINGRDKNVEVFVVTDGLQRLTAIFMFMLGLVKVPVYGRYNLRNSESEMKHKFFESIKELSSPERQPPIPLIYALDADKSWRINHKNPYEATVPEYVKQFINAVLRNGLEAGGKCDGQLAESLIMDTNERCHVYSLTISIALVPWSTKTASIVNVYQIAQQWIMSPTELVCITGDKATAWLKTLDATLSSFTGQFGVGFSMRYSLGALVQAFLITQGADLVPSIEDKHLWPVVVNELVKRYYDQEPSDEVKGRFTAALLKIDICTKSLTRKNSKLTTDDVAVMLAWMYEAIDASRVTYEGRSISLPGDIISEADRETIVNCFKIVRARSKNSVVDIFRNQLKHHAPRMSRNWASETGTAIYDSLRKKNERNLANVVSVMKDNIRLGTMTAADDEEEEDAEEEEEVQVPRARKTRNAKKPRIPIQADSDSVSSNHDKDDDYVEGEEDVEEDVEEEDVEEDVEEEDVEEDTEEEDVEEEENVPEGSSIREIIRANMTGDSNHSNQSFVDLARIATGVGISQAGSVNFNIDSLFP